MNGRIVFRVLAALLLVAVAVGIGTMVYNAGVTAGLAEAARQAVASGDPAPVVTYGYGHPYGPYFHGPFGGGFGFVGIFFWVLGIFLIIGLARAAFGRGRGWGPGRGGHGGWDGGRREMVEEWHREMHRGDPEGGPRPAGT